MLFLRAIGGSGKKTGDNGHGNMKENKIINLSQTFPQIQSFVKFFWDPTVVNRTHGTIVYLPIFKLFLR